MRWRMTLRGITRNRRRTALTVVGVVISICLVMVFAGLRDTVSSVIDRQYGGMEARLLSRLVAGENMLLVLLVLLGLPVGLLAGTWLADWFMSTYETQGYVWHLDMQSTTPLIVAVSVLIAALLAQIPAFRVIGRMDIAMVVRERSL